MKITEKDLRAAIRREILSAMKERETISPKEGKKKSCEDSSSACKTKTPVVDLKKTCQLVDRYLAKINSVKKKRQNERIRS